MIPEEEAYEKLIDELEALYPKMYSQPYGGVCTGPGWWPIITQLSFSINQHLIRIEQRRKWCIENGKEPPEPVEQVVVTQIKEKFGGLRFYYDGGDDYIAGLVEMAEVWAENACEVCGAPGKESNVRGWLQTLCDTHAKERSERINSKI